MAETYSLQYCLEHSPRIAPQRRKNIFFILTYNHGIVDWDDLVEWKPNYKFSMYGLTRHEVEVLADLRKKEILVRNVKEMGKEELKNRLISRSSSELKGEAIRTYNILIANGITNLRLFTAYSNDQLHDLKGIGPVRFKIIRSAKFYKSAKDNDHASK